MTKLISPRLLSILVVLALLLGPVSGAPFTSPARAAGPTCYVDDSANGANTGADLANAFRDLQTALADTDCTDIRVSAGTYKPTSTGDQNATFQLRSGVSISGAGYWYSILSGEINTSSGSDNSYHVVTASGVDSTARLSGFRIIDGYAIGRSGAGIYIDNGSPTLEGLKIASNWAEASGAGLYLNGGSPTLNNIEFNTNGVSYFGHRGGGMYVQAGSPTLNNVIFRNNHTYDGGGIYSLGNVTLNNVTFFDSYAQHDGGAIYVAGGTLEINGAVFSTDGSGNHADNDGGAIYVSAGDVVINDAEFTAGHAGRDGGALWVGGNLTMKSSRVHGNSSAREGGGIALPIAGSLVELTNVSITNNSVPLSTGCIGGGVYSYSNDPKLLNVLVANNTAYRGGGFALYGNSTPIFTNTTFYGNNASNAGSAMDIYNSHPELTNTIIWGNPGPGPDFLYAGIYAQPTIQNAILEEPTCPFGSNCSNILNNDPMFLDPAGGDFHLHPASPGVDYGDKTVLPQDLQDEDLDGDFSEPLPSLTDLNGDRRIVVKNVDLGALETQAWNTNWTEAVPLPLALVQPDVSSWSVDRYLETQGQSRWFKFTVQPSSKVLATLTGLPANYDLALYKDIDQAYDELNSSQDLTRLSAEFAPDTFSPDTFSPDTFSPDTFSPDTFSPDTFSPDTFSPDTFSPDTFSPDTFSPDTFSPDTFSPDTFSPDTFSPDTFSPDTFSPDTFSPDTFSSAQTRSLIAVSAHEGTLGEGIIANTWTKQGDFYLRVRGRNGAFDPDKPFHLQVSLLTGACGPVSPVLPASTTVPDSGGYQTMIVTNPASIEGSSADLSAMQTKLAALAGRTAGKILDVGSDARVSAAFAQAEANPACVYAMNLQAQTVKNIIDGFRALNPVEYVVLVGNDRAIPFFRYSDNALLANENDFSPPVLDNTTSQASLKSGYILSQDAYGAATELSFKSGTIPVPDLAVGRLVETAADINHVLDAYLGTPDGTASISSALVTGYDFLEDTANAVYTRLSESLGTAGTDKLITDSASAPQTLWSANDLRQSLFGERHDLAFLAGHFSAYSALAADMNPNNSLKASEVFTTTTDFTNSLVYSAGCHSGYNIVNTHDVPNVTKEPDWAQAFAAKGATFIGGTGYQYGDTDFIEYSERLYLELTRQLGYGNEPVAVGEALVRAKQAYLAGTPLMRGIHEKSVLEATLFGLPMLKFDLPARMPAPVDASIVSSIAGYPTNPGLALGLKFADVHVTPAFTEQTMPLSQVTETGGTSIVNTVYLEGDDGVVVNPAEPILPLVQLNVTAPAAGYVLRGLGWRGGSYTDLLDRVPLTGAATQDLGGSHPAFYSDVFFPVRPWNINYYDALGDTGGPTRLLLIPAQYRSTIPGSISGILRRFDGMDFRLFYSGNTATYTSSDPGWTNTPALSAPPDISHIASKDNGDGTVTIEVTATGDPAAGIQSVWVVFTLGNGGASGSWLPLDLTQDPLDTRLWKGTLSLGGVTASDLRFVVQAANGVGLVTMMTNEGKYYQVGIDPGALPQGEEPLDLVFVEPAAGGSYGSDQSFTLQAASSGNPVSGLAISFNLGGIGRQAVTGVDGRATVEFPLLIQPGSYLLSAAFGGDDTYAAASNSASFTITSAPTQLVLTPKTVSVSIGSSSTFTATVTSNGASLVKKPVVLTLESGGAVIITSQSETDYQGRASWTLPAQPPGSYTVKAWYGLPVSDALDLSTPYYEGSSDTASLVVNSFKFNGFFSPVDNPPVVNKAKAGSVVPVKFSLGGNFGLGIFAPGYPRMVFTACQSGVVDAIEETSTAGASGLSYNPLTGVYTYVWKTDKKWVGKCGMLVIQFIDGSQQSALFQFIK